MWSTEHVGMFLTFVINSTKLMEHAYLALMIISLKMMELANLSSLAVFKLNTKMERNVKIFLKNVLCSKKQLPDVSSVSLVGGLLILEFAKKFTALKEKFLLNMASSASKYHLSVMTMIDAQEFVSVV